MTEIPEHLLKRSKARKGTPAGDDASAAASASTAVTPTESSGPAQPPAIREAAAAIPRDPAPVAPKPVPPYVQAARTRKKMPMWAMAIIPFFTLLWAYSFAGTMQQPDVEDPLFTESAALYSSEGCAGCHGAGGGGGVGYAFSDGEIYTTFPAPIDQMVHIARGSAAIAGSQYGDPDRAGGARVAGNRGVMPNYPSLTQNQLELIVFHERATLGGEPTDSPAYQEWMDHMREVEEGNAPDHEIDLELFLSCANPEFTPEATGDAGDGNLEERNDLCPGPHVEADEEVAAG
ncbi:MAG: hypothetical protein HKN03_16860 [Acidimicrobiales bacterium]|nr:hypothetical protein [Acidimicrobiales bacterium]